MKIREYGSTEPGVPTIQIKLLVGLNTLYFICLTLQL